MAIDTSYYYITLNLNDGTPIQLDTYKFKSEADKYYNLMLNDTRGLKDTFISLSNIPIDEFNTLSLIEVKEKWGRQVSQRCISRNQFKRK